MRGWGSSRENKPNEHMKMLLKPPPFGPVPPLEGG